MRPHRTGGDGGRKILGVEGDDRVRGARCRGRDDMLVTGIGERCGKARMPLAGDMGAGEQAEHTAHSAEPLVSRPVATARIVLTVEGDT